MLRLSKFRHIVCVDGKRETWYEELDGTSDACGPDGNPIAASTAYLAVPSSLGGGSGISVTSLATPGKDRSKVSQFRAHVGPVTALAFGTFSSDRLITGSRDGVVKVWSVRGPGDGGVTETGASLTSGGDGVIALAPHVSLSGVVAVGYQGSVKIWDIDSGATVVNWDVPAPAKVHSVAWLLDGNRVAVTTNDHQLRVIDARSGSVTGSVESHKGVRPQRVVCCGDGSIITAGFDSGTSRSLALWDPRALSAPVSRVSAGQSTGSLLPLFDVDTNILLLPARGETTTRYFELSEGSLHLIGSCNGTEQTKGACFLPKTSVDVMGCEIDRVLRFTERGVVPMRVEVPRSDKTSFDRIADLFPPTVGVPASCSVTEWLAGTDACPGRVSMQPGAGGTSPIVTPPPITAARASSVSSVWATAPATKSPFAAAPVSTSPLAASPSPFMAPPVKPSSSPVAAVSSSSAAPSRPASISSIWASGPAAQASTSPLAGVSGPSPTASAPKQGAGRFAYSWATPQASPSPVTPVDTTPVAEPAAASRPVSAVFSPVAASPLKHVHADIPSQAKTYFNMTPDTTDPVPFVASTTHFAVPVVGGGGPFLVWPLASLGKLPAVPPVFAGHKHAVTALAFCPSMENIVVSGSGDSKLKAWDIEKPPADALRTTWSDHTHPITAVEFHPYVEGLFASASVDATIRLWDVLGDACRGTLTCPEAEIPVELSFSLDGTRIVSSFRDAYVRMFDPRASGASAVLSSFQPHTDNRPPHALFLGCSPYLLTSGASKARKRELKIWDSRMFGGEDVTPIVTEEFDSSPALLNPFYDADTGLVLLWSRGETQIRTYDAGSFWQSGSETTPQLVPCATCKGLPSPNVGLTVLPKRVVNVREVEVARVLRLSNSTIEPLSFTIARAAHLKPYFQDDLYVPAVAGEASLSIDEFLGEGKSGQVTRSSLQPADMMPVSSKPPEPATNTTKKMPTTTAAIRAQHAQEADRAFMDRVAVAASALGGSDSSDSDGDWSD